MIDYVLNVSGHKDLFYVGHSQGTVMGFAGFSSMPELASKVKVFAALAPVATVKYIEGAFKIFTEFYKILAVSCTNAYIFICSCCRNVFHCSIDCFTVHSTYI